MIHPATGNLLKADAQALVNTVNTEGVMGKGIALQFRRAYPAVFSNYEAACKSGEVKLGKMHIVDLGGLVGGPRWIINFPTKGHWRSRSRLADIRAGLQDLVHVVSRLGITSIAIPPLGCGNGGLEWSTVKPLIEDAFGNLPSVNVLLYPPSGSPDAEAMPDRTEKPHLTVGRASLIALIARYREALLDPLVSLLEIHKLMYFLQEAGEELKLNYKAHTYGPYAVNLRQVMIRLEGHYLLGYGAGEDTPTKPIELAGNAASEAAIYLSKHPEVLTRMERVAKLIEGFEDPYGMELLSSMHWVMCHAAGARDSLEEAINLVQQWNPGKRRRLKPEHLEAAWTRLKAAKWDTESRSAVH